MVDAIQKAAEAAELRKRFGAEAAKAEEATLRSGKAYDAREVFDYPGARAHGKKVRRPKARAWRAFG